MNKKEKRENYSLNPATISQNSTKSQPQRDISKDTVQFEIPLALLDWLAKINQRLITQNSES